MPRLVNNELVPEELIQVEIEKLRHMPGWDTGPNGFDAKTRLREAAVECAIKAL